MQRQLESYEGVSMSFFSQRKKQKEQEDVKAVADLIEEQRLKETAEIYRRGWCVERATMTVDSESPDIVLRMARAIYEYVYGEPSK